MSSTTKLIIGGLIVVGAITLPYFSVFHGRLSDVADDWGNFGAYVGGLLSPILAVGSLYYVIKTFRQQSFESTLNLLLEQHNKVAERLIEGVEKTKVKEHLDKLGNEWLYQKDQGTHKFEINYDQDANQYVRVLYQVLAFIDQSCPDDDKTKYTRILRSFIPHEVLVLVALNACQESKSGKPTFSRYKELIEKYSILEHMLEHETLHPPKYVEVNPNSNIYLVAKRYNSSAFGDGYNMHNFFVKNISKIILNSELHINNLEKAKIEKEKIKEFRNKNDKDIIRLSKAESIDLIEDIDFIKNELNLCSLIPEFKFTWLEKPNMLPTEVGIFKDNLGEYTTKINNDIDIESNKLNVISKFIDFFVLNNSKDSLLSVFCQKEMRELKEIADRIAVLCESK